MKTIIERGASWTLEETKMLLALWGQDFVQRQATNTKRTKECYEKISEKFSQNGFERTAEQVRTRVFNMIAEYRRILRDPNPERMKKCIFFETLHKIYQAKHLDDVKSALDDYEPDFPYSPASNTFFSHMGDESVSDSEVTDGNESIIATNNATTNNNSSSNNNNSSTAATTAATSNTNNASQANSTTSSASNSTNSSANTTSGSANDDDNIGDSNNNNNNNNNASSSSNNNNNEKGTSSSSNSHQLVGGSAAKKVKLESPHAKSGHNQTANQSASMAAPSSSSSSSSSSNSEHVNTKHGKSTAAAASASTTPQVNATAATTFASGSSALGSSNSSSIANLAAGSSSQRHQSLLLQPNSTSSGTSTPISKITTSASNNTPSFLNLNSTKQIPIIRTMGSLSNGNEAINLNGTNRLATTAAITSHQLYQAPVNTFDVTSSALLIDRMFAHLSRESENMREWIALEKERLALERARRQQETEREVRRERVLIDTLMRFQEQWLSFLSRLDPRLIENAAENPPELRIPPNKDSAAEASQSTQSTTTTATNASVSATTSLNNNTTPSTDTSK